MNSIFLILLLLSCCNHNDDDGNGSCGCPGQNARRDDRRSDCDDGGSRRDDGGSRRDDNGSRRDDNRFRRDDSPFSPFGRSGDCPCRENDYPEFRGNNGPCGCEDTKD